MRAQRYGHQQFVAEQALDGRFVVAGLGAERPFEHVLGRAAGGCGVFEAPRLVVQVPCGMFQPERMAEQGAPQAGFDDHLRIRRDVVRIGAGLLEHGPLVRADAVGGAGEGRALREDGECVTVRTGTEVVGCQPG